jgi:hypothetical protein
MALNVRSRVRDARPHKDHRAVDLISDALPFGRLWYGEPDAVANDRTSGFVRDLSGRCLRTTLRGPLVMSESNTLPSLQDFCVAVPLYTEFKIEEAQRTAVYNLITKTASIDCFCVDCQQPSVFLVLEIKITKKDFEFRLDDRIFTRECLCSRRHHHSAYFHFRLNDGVLSKIGQSPSMADTSESELRSYRTVLTNEDFRELARAVGLASHGVGIGSFVYLRRIFERLIDEAREQATSDADWNNDLFKQSRMDDKIEPLKPFLPAFLVEQRKLYSILSKGIHELTEIECLESFPIVRTGIELILDQKVAAKQQHEKMQEAKKRIADLQKRITKT